MKAMHRAKKALASAAAVVLLASGALSASASPASAASTRVDTAAVSTASMSSNASATTRPLSATLVPAAVVQPSNVRRGIYLTLTGCRIAGWAGILTFRWTVFTCAPEILGTDTWYRLYTDK